MYGACSLNWKQPWTSLAACIEGVPCRWLRSFSQVERVAEWAKTKPRCTEALNGYRHAFLKPVLSGVLFCVAGRTEASV